MPKTIPTKSDNAVKEKVNQLQKEVERLNVKLDVRTKALTEQIAQLEHELGNTRKRVTQDFTRLTEDVKETAEKLLKRNPGYGR